MNYKILGILLIIILLNFFCVSERPAENSLIKIYEMTEVEVWYYDLYCNEIIDRQIILDKKLKTNIGRASGKINVFGNLISSRGSYSYSEDYPLNESSILFSGVDSLNSNIDISNGKIKVKIFENLKDLSEFIQENSKGEEYFRIAYITKIYIEGIISSY